MLVLPNVFSAQLCRPIYPGDLLAGGEAIQSLTTVGNGTITAALMVAGIINRSGPTAAYTDTTDTAANILAALIGPAGYSAGVLPNTTFRLRYINSVAFAMTLAAGAGVTLGANTGVAASSVKEYLCTVTNGTPQVSYAANTTNGSAVLTGLTPYQTQFISVGMAVSGTGIPANTVVTAVNPSGSVTLNNNATATNLLTAITFTPTLTINSLGQYSL